MPRDNMRLIGINHVWLTILYTVAMMVKEMDHNSHLNFSLYVIQGCFCSIRVWKLYSLQMPAGSQTACVLNDYLSRIILKLVLNEILERVVCSMVPRPWQCGPTFCKFTIWRLPPAVVPFCIRQRQCDSARWEANFWQLNLEPATPGFINHLIPGNIFLLKLVRVVSVCPHWSPVDMVLLLEDEDMDAGWAAQCMSLGPLSSISIFFFHFSLSIPLKFRLGGSKLCSSRVSKILLLQCLEEKDRSFISKVLKWNLCRNGDGLARLLKSPLSLYTCALLDIS